MSCSPHRTSIFISTWVVLSFLLLNQFSKPVWAAPATNAISVTPAMVQLDLSREKPVSTVSYTNHTNQEIQLNFSASDFTALEDGYKMAFLTDKNAENYQYRLASWISFDQTSLLLKAGQTGSVKVMVNAKELSPGAHYGTILARIEQNPGTESIQIQSVLSSLLFVRTNTGQEKESATIQSFNVKENWWGFPSQIEVRLNNTGETDLIPHGLVEITDSWGRYVAKAVVNEDSLDTLPQTVRRYTLPIRSIGPFRLPSRYQARLTLKYGKSETALTSQLNFYSIGSPVFWLIPIGLFLLTIWRLSREKKPNRETPVNQ